MNCKSILSVFLVVFLTLSFTGCSDMNKPSIQKEKEPIEKILVNEIPGSIALVADPDSSTEGMYADLTIKTVDNEKSTTWKTLRAETWLPTLELIDFFADEDPELYIKLTTDEGTGVLMEEVHILSLPTLEEFTIENPLTIIEKTVKDLSNTDAYKFILNGKEKTIEKKALYGPADTLFDKPVFENIIKYNIIDNALTAIVPIQLSATEFYGEFAITYKFNGKAFCFESITYAPPLK